MPILVRLYCGNAMCPEYRRTGRREFIGEVERGAFARLRCRKCREVRTYRALEPAVAV